jgi:uncharacterized membrane protein
MRHLLRTILPILVIAALVHIAVIWATPRLVMHRVLHIASAHGTPFHAPQPTAADRKIPLPSPDLLYSTCVLNLSAGPILASVTPGPDYLSLAIFNAATDNVFVANDQTAQNHPIRLLITNTPTANPPASTTIVQLGTTKGLLLLRALAATPAQQTSNEAARKTLTCAPLK